MGNDLLTTQTSAIGSSAYGASTAANPYYNPSGMSGMYGSLFNIPNYGKDYSNDLMMPDCLKSGYPTSGSVFNTNTPTVQSGTAAQTQAAQQQTPSFGAGQAQAQNPYYNILNRKDTSQKTSGSAGKKIGAAFGALAPIAAGIYKVVKGANASSLKSLAVKVPVFAIAGWCAGAIFDTLRSGKKSEQPETAAAQQAQTQTQTV